MVSAHKGVPLLKWCKEVSIFVTSRQTEPVTLGINLVVPITARPRGHQFTQLTTSGESFKTC